MPFDLAEANPVKIFSSSLRNHTSTNLNAFINLCVGTTHQDVFLNKKFYAQRRYYSSGDSQKDLLLNPQWITGFVDGEGSFGLKVYKSEGYKFGWRFEPFFQIKLNLRDLKVLQRIQIHFGGVGKISFEKNSAKYVVRVMDELLRTVIPHFEMYPLLTKKFADFELFRQIVLILSAKGHRTEEGFLKVLSLRYNLNKGISSELIKLFPNLVPVDRPLVPEREISPEWLVGFVDGEGSFNIFTGEKLTNSLTTPVSRKVWLYFQITQHGRDILLLERIATYLHCGSVKRRNTPAFDTCDYKLTGFDMIDSKILPFFNKYSLQSAKRLDYQYFVNAADIIRNKQSKQWIVEEFNKIKNIQSIMNKYAKNSLAGVENND